MANAALEAVIWLQLACFILFWPIVTPLYYKNRFQYPIKGRHPNISLVLAFILGVYQINLILLFHTDYPCPANFIVQWIAKTYAAIIYLYRAVLLLFHSEITKNLMAIQSRQNLQLGWYVEHRSWITLRSFAIVLVIWTIIGIIYIPLAITGGDFFYETCTTSTHVANKSLQFHVLATNAIAVIIVLLCALIGIKLWTHDNDSLYIKQELKFTFIFYAVTLCIYATIGIQNTLNVAVISAIAAWIPFLFSLLWPYYLSISNQYQQKLRTQELKQDPELREILYSPTGFLSFLGFIKKEFSSENALFWKDVEDYRKLTEIDGPRAFDLANKIMSQYLCSSAPFQVNIGAESSQAVIEKMYRLSPTAPEPNVFDEPQNEIYMLMVNDSLQRYLMSEEYELWKVMGREPSKASDLAQMLISNPDKGENVESLDILSPPSMSDLKNGTISVD